MPTVASCRVRCTAPAAFASLDAAFPPSARSRWRSDPRRQAAPSTISAALPWIEQARALLAPSELGGVAKDLHASAPTSPAGRRAVSFQQQIDHFSQCLTKVFLPAGNAKLQDGPSTSGVEDYKEFWYAMAGLAGPVRASTATAPTASWSAAAATRCTPAGRHGWQHGQGRATLVARAPLAPQGTRPRFPAIEPPYKPLVPCYTQALPDFNGPLSSGPADGGGG